MPSSSSPSSTKKVQPCYQPPRLSTFSAPSTAPLLVASPRLSPASHPEKHNASDDRKPVTVRTSATLGVATSLPTPPPSLASKIPTLIFDLPSAPIPIPAPRPKFDAATSYVPTTPLTAREKAGHRFPNQQTPAKPQLGRSLNPRYAHHSHQGRAVSYYSDDSTSPTSSAGSSASLASLVSMHRDRPSSPLSPSLPIPLSPVSPMRQSGNQLQPRPTSRPSPKLQLKSLPRFHPANYESPSSSTDITPRSSRPGTAQPHFRQVSDAQKKLQQYQRDVVTNATRAALTLSPKTPVNPNAPRLDPMGSPGPVTPLALEGGGDYLLAGSLGSTDAKTDRGRELVQRLVEKENERRSYPRRSESHSPAVSPAGGRV